MNWHDEVDEYLYLCSKSREYKREITALKRDNRWQKEWINKCINLDWSEVDIYDNIDRIKENHARIADLLLVLDEISDALAEEIIGFNL